MGEGLFRDARLWNEIAEIASFPAPRRHEFHLDEKSSSGVGTRNFFRDHNPALVGPIRPISSRYSKDSTVKTMRPPLGLHRLRLFFALSRTPHGLMDMTAPAFAACLWLGGFPEFSIILLGLPTAFAGYTAVYALNDLVDVRLDRQRLAEAREGERVGGPDLDAALARHPVAQGLLSFGEGLAWALGWGAVALLGAWLLNPVCALIFLAGCLLEATYCLLFRVSPLRTLVNGIVKTLGAVAAVYAVDPAPEFPFVPVLFAMFFFWEIGGQNLPNDCSDMEEDRRLGARTFAVAYGWDISAFAALATLAAAVALSLILPGLSGTSTGLPFFAALIAIDAYLLLLPALAFHRRQTPEAAMLLFNRASHFPPALFALVLARFALPGF
jgi:4-hydroxybenzoate polyprenyltransferase